MVTTFLLLTISLSGSSGGPLIDNEGFVIGVTTWGHKVEQYNGSDITGCVLREDR